VEEWRGKGKGGSMTDGRWCWVEEGGGVGDEGGQLRRHPYIRVFFTSRDFKGGEGIFRHWCWGLRNSKHISGALVRELVYM
jgi:hypothetical protein